MKEIVLTATTTATRSFYTQVTDEEHEELVRVVTKGTQGEQADKAFEIMGTVLGREWDVDEGGVTLDLRDV